MTAAEKLAIISSISRIRSEDELRQLSNGGTVEEFYARVKTATETMLEEVDKAWQDLAA